MNQLKYVPISSTRIDVYYNNKNSGKIIKNDIGTWYFQSNKYWGRIILRRIYNKLYQLELKDKKND